jgi:PAS domain S-box-containing protein
MSNNIIEKDQEIARLKAQVTALEQLLAAHEQTSLEQSNRLEQALRALTKRAAELEMVTQVSVAVSTTLETNKLLQEVVDLTKSRFNLYHAHIYLLDKTGNSLNLAVGAGAVGRQMVAEGWSIPLTQQTSLVARAARTRQGVIVNNVHEAPDWLPNPLLPNTHSELAVPMIVGNQLLGVLDVQAAEVDYFTDEDVRIQTILASQMAVALQNAARYDQTQTMLSETELQARRLVLLNEMSAEANLAISREDIFNIIVNRVSGMLATDQISLNLLRGAGDTLEVVAIEREAFDGVTNMVQLADTPMETALRERRIIHTQNDPAQSVMIAPLFMGEEAIGTLNVGRFQGNAFNPNDENLLRQIASILGITIKNRRLFEQMQQRAAEQEEATIFLDTIVENIPTGIFIKDAKDFKYLRINRAHAEISGLNQAGVIGTSVYDYFPKEQADFFTAKDRETMAKGKLVDIPEQPMQTVKKGLRWLHTQKIPIYGADGQPKYLLGLSEDITERKQTEEMLASRAAELEETTNFLNSVIENLPTMLFVKDAEELRFVRWNKAGEELMGISREDMIGKNDYDLVPKEDADFFTGKDREVLAGGQLLDIPEEVIHTRQGTRYLHTRKIPIFGPDGQPRYLLGISEDITERKQAEEMLANRAAELEETTTFLDSVIENLPTMLFVKEATDLRFVRWNKAGEELIGYPRAALIGKNDYDFFPKEEADFFTGKDREVLAGGKLVDIPEEPIATAHQGIRYLHTRKIPIYGPDGKPRYLLGISEDITERKQAEELLASRAAELEETTTLLREHEARLAEALSMAQLANWEFDVATQTFTFNDQFYSLFRTTAEQEGGYLMPAMQYAQKFVHPADAPLVGVAIKEAIETTDPNYFFQIDHRIIRADGSEGYILVRFRVVKDEQGRTVKTIGANQDITELKQAELEKEHLLADMRAIQRQYIRQEWDRFLTEQHHGAWRIEYSRPEAQFDTTPHPLTAIQQQALNRGQTQVLTGSGGNGFNTHPTIITPITLRGEILGTLSLQDIDPGRQWSEEEVALIEAVSEQLALTLENLRLFDNTQQRASREQLARRITDKMRQAPDVETIIETGITELARVLGASRTYVKLSAPLKSSAEETADDVDAIRARLRQAGFMTDPDQTTLSSPQKAAPDSGSIEGNL